VAPLWYAPALAKNIRPGGKWLKVTNVLAYLIPTMNGLILFFTNYLEKLIFDQFLSPEANIINLFTSVIYEFLE
jgi:hypothetical protein